MASIIVLVIIAVCVVLGVLKAGAYKSALALVSAVLASVTAFAFYEPLAAMLIGKEKMVEWAHAVCLLVLFAISFGILIGIAIGISRWKVEFESGPEKAAGAVIGILLGMVISGVVVTALLLAPLGPTMPYARFETPIRDVDSPAKALLNTEGLVTGLFSAASSGSLSGGTSFAVARADLLDQAYLTRMKVADKIPPVGTADALRVPQRDGAWPVASELVDPAGNPVNPASGCELMIIRLSITSDILKNGTFTLAQLRAVCKQPDQDGPLTGKGTVAYPIGYMVAENMVVTKDLTEKIALARMDVSDRERYIDFVFNVPSGLRPVLVELKRLAIAEVSYIRSMDQIPQTMAFVPENGCSKGKAELHPSKTGRLYGVSIGTGDDLLADLQLSAADANEWQKYQTAQTTMPAQFRGARLSCVSASLKVPQQAEQGSEKGLLGKILDVPDGYKLVSLTCNIVSPGSQITAAQYPVLVDLKENAHRPVGAVAVGSAGDASLYQVDYCPASAAVSEDGVVTTAFPAAITTPADAAKTEAIYFIYMIKAGSRVIISSVKPAGAETAAGFKSAEGLFIN